MSKPFTTVTRLHGKEPLLRNMTCEVRYEDGYFYLDRCGKLLKKLIGDGTEWVVTSNPTAQATTVFHILDGMALGFGFRSASLTLDRTVADEVIGAEEAEAFVKQAGDVLEEVIDELEVTEFTRVGYREQYYFPFENKEESEKWIGELGLFSAPENLLAAFHATPEALLASVVVQGHDCRYRIALSGIERSAQIPVGDLNIVVQTSAATKKQKRAVLEAMKKKRQRQIDSAFAVVLDIDAFLLEPAECDLATFVGDRNRTNLQMFRDAVEKQTQKGKSK
jgi:hypothetical protein